TTDLPEREGIEMKKDVLTFQEAMELLGFKKSAMYQLLKLPHGPKFTQIGSRKIITRRALLKWIEDHAGSRIK
ncbi:MAG: helix-turn-helix domain-containing protein, partial [Lachnospiraceae bacterium]|nr:helix-turn-helix domain-containing protein [Lachnospiraceae bacterium]